MSDQKIKTAAGKAPLNLVPQASLIGPARVAQHGSIKYARGNWHTADDVMGIADRYMGGVLRHATAMQNTNGTYDMMSIGKLDDESGLPEIDHMIMGLLMLRGLAIKHEFMPADPGESVYCQDVARRARKLEAREAMIKANQAAEAPIIDNSEHPLHHDPKAFADAIERVHGAAPLPFKAGDRVFKVGDRVRTVNIKPPTADEWVGRTGVIEDDRHMFSPPCNLGYNVRVDGCDTLVAFRGDELELIVTAASAPGKDGRP